MKPKTARVLAAGAGLLLVAGLATAVQRVPEGFVGVSGAREGSAPPRLLRAGWHLRVPFLETTVLLPAAPVKVEHELILQADAGDDLHLPCRFWLSAQHGDARVLLEEVRDGDIAAAARLRLSKSDGHGAEAAPRRDRAAAWIVDRLLPLGLVESSLIVGEVQETGESRSDPIDEVRRTYHGPSQPLLLVGLDGADWSILEPLMDAGDLSILAGLRARGAWGSLRSMRPTLSPLLWTTVVTGRTPDEHGIVDFLVRDPASGRDVPISSDFRKVHALWSILTEVDRPSLTVGWWATWPAEPVLGSMATDRIAYALFESGGGPAPGRVAWPDRLVEALPGLVVKPEDVTFDEIGEIVGIEEADFERARSLLADPSSWEDPLAHLIRILASTRTYHAIALHEIARGQPPLSLVYYQGIDEVSHRFAHYAPPAMRWADPSRIAAYRDAVPNFYRLQDRLLGELLDAVEPETVVLVISDHGFAWGDGRPADVPPDIEGQPGRWHTMEGVILATGATVRPGRLPEDPGLLDIAPTVLALLSLPASDEMPGKPIEELVGRGAPGSSAHARIASYEGGIRRPHTAGPAAVSGADDEIIARLTALGYVGGEDATPSAPAGPAPAMTVTGHLNAGNAFLVRRDHRSAEREFRAALELAPAYLPARLGLAQSLIATGRSEEGYAEIETALRESPALDAGTLMTIARFYLERRESARGARVFGDLDAEPGLEAARLVALGILLDAAGEGGAGEDALRRGLRLDPASPEALQQMYGLLTRRGELRELESILRRALEARPNQSQAANLLALTLERGGRRIEAVAILEEQLRETPRSLPTLANLAGLHIRSGNDERALPLLERAIEIDPTHAESLINLVVVKGKRGDLEGARETFRRAGGASAPVEALNAMAYALFLNGRLADAKDLIVTSLRRKPGQTEVQRLLAAIEDGERSKGDGGPEG